VVGKYQQTGHWKTKADGQTIRRRLPRVSSYTIGGPEGSALAIMMVIISGVLSGSASVGHGTNPYDPSRPADVSHVLIAINTSDLFVSMDEFEEISGGSFSSIRTRWLESITSICHENWSK